MRLPVTGIPPRSPREVFGSQPVGADDRAGADLVTGRVNLVERRSVGQQLQCVLQGLEVVGALDRYAAAGVRRLVLSMPSGGADEVLPALDAYVPLIERYAG